MSKLKFLGSTNKKGRYFKNNFRSFEYGHTGKDSKVIFQSFGYPNLIEVKTKWVPKINMDLGLVALIGRKGTKETYELKGGK